MAYPGPRDELVLRVHQRIHRLVEERRCDQISALAESPITETPDTYGAYPRLTDNQFAALAAVGVPRQVKVGDVLYREGDGTSTSS